MKSKTANDLRSVDKLPFLDAVFFAFLDNYISNKPNECKNHRHSAIPLKEIQADELNENTFIGSHKKDNADEQKKALPGKTEIIKV